LLCLFLAGPLGCTTMDKTARKIARDLNPTSGSMKIRMALLPLDNKTSLKPEFLETAFQKPFSLNLRRKCTDLLTESETLLPRPLTTGDVDPMDPFLLSEAGRRRGFNAVAAIRLESFGVRVEQRGILWFKGDRHLLQAHADAEIWDTVTGTKALSQDFYVETPVDEALYLQIRSGKDLEVPPLQKALSKIAEEAAAAVCESVDSLPWRGFILSAGEDTVSLSSGKRAGLQMGAVLAVFGKGSLLQGAGGRRYLLPGKVIGEIRITAVGTDTAEARILSGGPFSEGDSVGFP